MQVHGDRKRGDRCDPNDRPDLVFKTSDGYLTAGTISDSEWQGFCKASGDPELARDPRFATPSARSVNATAADQQDGRVHRSAYHRRVAGNGSTPPTYPARRSCAAARLSINEQVGGARHHRGVRSADGRTGAAAEAGGAVSSQRSGDRWTRAARRRAFHEVLRELGYSDGAIDKMIGARAVRVAV